jgi:WhiB family transcriptional regulator, redox-sensing transcriptional regulator
MTFGHAFKVNLTDTKTDWFENAACRGEDINLFFPGTGEIPFTAFAICSRCPVRRECLDYALTNHIQHGVFGGIGPRQRRRVRGL